MIVTSSQSRDFHQQDNYAIKLLMVYKALSESLGVCKLHISSLNHCCSCLGPPFKCSATQRFCSELESVRSNCEG